MVDPQPAEGDGPRPPWRSSGECVLAWVRPPRALRDLLPQGVSPLPGRAALVGVSYVDSPVGPYLELSLGLPARLGLRPGLCVVFQAVSDVRARRASQALWGLPATVAALSWAVEGDERVMRCEEPGLELRGIPVGPRFPAIVPVRSVQRRADGPVVVPRRFLALVRLSRSVVSTAPSFLEGLAGAHPGAVMAGARVVTRPARHPTGAWSSLRAPLPAPEPAAIALRMRPKTATVARVTPRTGA